MYFSVLRFACSELPKLTFAELAGGKQSCLAAEYCRKFQEQRNCKTVIVTMTSQTSAFPFLFVFYAHFSSPTKRAFIHKLLIFW